MGILYDRFHLSKMTGHFPSANEHEIAGKVGYHLREGEHLLDTFDWMCLVDHLKDNEFVITSYAAEFL